MTTFLIKSEKFGDKGWKGRDQSASWFGFWRGLSSWLAGSFFRAMGPWALSWVPVWVLREHSWVSSSSCSGTGLVWFRVHPITSFNTVTFWQALSPNTVTLGLGLQPKNFGGHSSGHSGYWFGVMKVVQEQSRMCIQCVPLPLGGTAV